MENWLEDYIENNKEELEKGFTDFLLFGEEMNYISKDGTIRHIPFGSEEYSKILVELAIGRELTEEEITEIKQEYGQTSKEI